MQLVEHWKHGLLELDLKAFGEAEMFGICIFPLMTYREELQRNPVRNKGLEEENISMGLTQKGFVVKFLFTTYSKNASSHGTVKPLG